MIGMNWNLFFDVLLFFKPSHAWKRRRISEAMALVVCIISAEAKKITPLICIAFRPLFVMIMYAITDPSTGENIGNIHERLLEIMTNVVLLCSLRFGLTSLVTVAGLCNWVLIAMWELNQSRLPTWLPTPKESLWLLSLLVDLHLIRILADPRDKVLLDLVAPPTRNPKNQVVEGRPSQDIHMITCNDNNVRTPIVSETIV